MQKLDIGYRQPEGPAKILSNLYAHKFVFDGVECASVEGLLQAFKFEDTQYQQEVCARSGLKAWKSREEPDAKLWFKSQTLLLARCGICQRLQRIPGALRSYLLRYNLPTMRQTSASIT